MIRSMEKKGMVNGLILLGYGLITFAVIIAVGLLVLQNLSATTVDKLVAGTTAAESITPKTAGTALAAYSLSDPVCTITSAQNYSAAGKLINTANYTVDTTCILKNTTAEFVDRNWVVNYTYTHTQNSTASSTIRTVMGYLGSGSGGLVTWIPAIIALVIGIMLIGAFGGKGKRKV